MTVECLDYKSHASGALQGFANFRVPKMGVELFGCGVFMKNGKRWVSMPSRQYEEDGEKKYISVMRFIEKDHADAFSKIALQALDDWCAKNTEQELIPAESTQEEIPF